MEKVILKQLVENEVFNNKTIAFLQDEYFRNNAAQKIFQYIYKYVETYKKIPSEQVLTLAIATDETLNESLEEQTTELLAEMDLHNPKMENLDWLITETEKWARDAAIYNAITRSITIIDGSDASEKLDKNALPELLSDALAISIDTNIGHDFIEDAESRYDFYHNKESKLPFDIEMLNKVTDGGFSRKTLNVIMGGTGAGKTLTKCHLASSWLSMGQNVLYITLEMAEERIAQRIDANLLNVNVSDIEKLPHDIYAKKIEELRAKTKGKLIIKEYSPASAHVGHFRFLLKELRMKKKFMPDVILVDYLNLMMSARLKPSENLYQYVKFIAEELRGLAVEFNVPIVSSTQLNRTGFSDSDPGLDHTAESFGLPATVDSLFVLIATEELDALHQIMWKQLKNRYRDENMDRKFIVGREKAKMRLYDVAQVVSEQVSESNITPRSNIASNGVDMSQKKDRFANFKI